MVTLYSMNNDTNLSESTLESMWERILEESEGYTLSIETQEKNQGFETDQDNMPSIEDEFDTLMQQVSSALPADDIRFNEAIIKENLEEVLLLLIALHGETHGKELLSNLAHFFDTQLSPGNMYPCLHKLEAEEVLAMHSMVRTKKYSIEDEDAARATIEHTMVQHLAFGLLLYAFLPRL